MVARSVVGTTVVSNRGSLKIVAGVTRRTVLSYGSSSDTTVVTNTVGAKFSVSYELASHIIVTTAITNGYGSGGIQVPAGFVAKTTALSDGNVSGPTCTGSYAVARTTSNLCLVRASTCSQPYTLSAGRAVKIGAGHKLTVILGENLLISEIDATSPGGGGLILHAGLPHTAEDTHIGGLLDLEPVQEGAFGASLLGRDGCSDGAGLLLAVGDTDARGDSGGGAGGEVGCSGDGGDGGGGEGETHGMMWD